MDQLSRAARIRRNRGSSGFTLIETVIALAILAVGILAVAASMLTAVKLSRTSRSSGQAMYLAQQQLETLQAMPLANVEALVGVAGYPNDPAGPIDPDPGDHDNTLFVRRSFVQPNTPEPGVATLLVEVDWVDEYGATRTVALRSLKAGL